MSAPSGRKEEIRANLVQLRDTPAGTQDASESVLGHIYQFLIEDSNSPKARTLHWFCSRADPIVVEAATFLLRLHAYSSPRVKVWRGQLKSCLAGCSDCVRALQEAKVTSRHTYFGAFSDEVLKHFYRSFSEWELSAVLEELIDARIESNVAQDPKRSLCDAPPALTYHLLSNLQILQDQKVIDIFRSHTPTSVIAGWPTDIPPAGLLILLMDSKLEVRAWAAQQIATYKKTPIQSEQFLPMYAESLEAATNAISSSDVKTSSEGMSGETAMKSAYMFSQDTTALWSGYCLLLRCVPREWFQPSDLFRQDLRRIVVGHLSDAGTHFMEVFKCFLLILNRIGPDVWKGEGPEYPLVVFNTIKDNPYYCDTLLTVHGSGHDQWMLNCWQPYLKSLGDLPAFKEVLPAVIQFLCEELQHERFKEIRAASISVASKLLAAVVVQSQHTPDGTSPEYNVAWESLDIHTGIFVSVAFGKSYAADSWKDARSASRKLIKYSLTRDIKTICATVTQLAVPSRQTAPLLIPTIREQMWKQLYATLHPSDPDGIAIILSVLSQIAHMYVMSEPAFADAVQKAKNPQEAKKALATVNHAFEIFRRGFSDAVTRFLDFSSSGAMLRLLRQDDVAKDVMMLMFSPVDEIREPAQAIAGLALDVESRQDCFRAMFVSCPNAALNGMFDFLETFNKYAQIVPEACSVSKSLALCLTDIIDVMCSNPDGLLLQDKFLKSVGDPGPSVELPKLWSLMTKALSVIFLRTPRWSTYFENATMVLWMRDALIFGRDMLAQRKVIEMGALAQSSQSSSSGRNRKLSRIGKKMVDNLQQVLLELTRWLRLTDEELLHQSFALLQSLLGCFRETQIPPAEATLQKLQKHVDDARKGDPNRPQTRLDSTRLTRLQETLSSFVEDDDDEVEIISHYKPSEQNRASKKPSPESGSRRKKEAVSQLGVQQKYRPRDAVQSRQPPAKTTLSSYFSSGDQKKLDSASSLPKFTKPAQPTAPVASSSKVTPVLSAPPIRGGSVSTKTSVAESSSNSEESDGDGEGTLEALAKMQKTPTVKKPVERRQVKMLDIPTKGRNSIFDRLNRRDDARRNGLRLKPDISSLHRTVLSWSYDHDGPVPPSDQLRLFRVPDRFNDTQHYRRIFEPLLLLECWSQIQQSKDEVQDVYECRIVSRQFSDDWIDLEIFISEGVKKDWSLSDADVVLLRHPDSKKSFLGKTQSYRAQPNGIQSTIRLMLPSHESGPQINSNWRLSKVFSLTTVHREYGALMGLPYYDLCDTIMQPMLSKKAVVDSREVQQTMTTYNLNEPQAKAILNSMKTDGFSLIQGPPGTGKTSTICSLVQMFLERRPKPATAIYAGRASGPADREPPKKILLCAPSNAAIDEITYRLKEGVSGAGRRTVRPKVVRVGAPRAMNISVKDVSLDYLVEQKLNADPETKSSPRDAGGEIARLRAEMESVKQLRNKKLAELDTIHDNTAKTLALEEEIKKLGKQRVALTHQFDKLKDKQKSDYRTLDAISRKYRAEVLLEADVICSTLSGSGHELLEAYDFEMVVIDEAAQAIELSSLIPLKYRCSRCIMVGDPQQLPPTVISQEATKYAYNQSLFVRLQKHRPDAVHLLSIQYRMHPDISQLPSRLFYDGRLIDGPDMATKTQKPWHTDSRFGTYRFFNVNKGREESGNSRSLLNRAECQVAVALFRRLIGQFKSYDFDFKVGVVSMYRAQVLELRRQFEQAFGSNITSVVDFHTVDGFQGQEKEVIILSCVRAGPGLQNVGFLSDTRRMNVALTRAKSSVYVLGHAATLERSDQTWRSIVLDAKTRGCLVDTDVAYFTSPISKPLPQVSKSPRNESKAVESPAPALVTPHELYAVGRRAFLPEAAQSNSIANTNGDASLLTNHSLPGTSRKRPVPDDDNAPPRSALPPPAISLPSEAEQSRDEENAKPKPKPKALIKRQKQQTSIFIPQKKRPAPTDSEAGPATSRRRL